jgi:hypothetical protein
MIVQIHILLILPISGGEWLLNAPLVLKPDKEFPFERRLGGALWRGESLAPIGNPSPISQSPRP